jgi:methionine synthase II (cobalamin-independent)
MAGGNPVQDWPRAGWQPGRMTEITCYLHGSYPHSEALVAVARDAARGRRPASDVREQRHADREALRALQREAGLTLVSSGMLGWQDLFRPLVAACPGWSAGPLRRWFATNTFVRTPVVRGTAGLDRLLLAAQLDEHSGAGDAGQVATLPGPYTFSRIADAAQGRDELIGILAEKVLRPAAEELAARGARVVHLQEPWLAARGIDDGCWPYLASALHQVRDGLGVPVIVHTYFGDAGPWLDRLRALPADAVGVDLTETDIRPLSGRWATGLLAGCIDGRSSLVEDAASTAALARRIIGMAEPPWLILTSGCDLELLPKTVADRKTRVLGEAARRLALEPAC